MNTFLKYLKKFILFYFFFFCKFKRGAIYDIEEKHQPCMKFYMLVNTCLVSFEKVYKSLFKKVVINKIYLCAKRKLV